MKASTLTKHLNGRLLRDDIVLFGVNQLAHAKEHDLSFVIWPKDVSKAKKTKASAILCELDFAASYAHEVSSSLIVVDDLGHAFKTLYNLKKANAFLAIRNERMIAKTATIHPSAVINNSQIENNTIIEANVFIDDGVFIGSDCFIGANSVIYGPTSIGNNVQIGAGSVIGSNPFVPVGIKNVYNLMPLGGVVIDDFTSIGAKCSISCGLISNTTIGSHTLIDNCVHVGHDVCIKSNVIVAGQTGFAGLSVIDDDVTIGGQCGIAPHVEIKKGARISGKSLVHKNVKAYEVWSGNPAVLHKEYLKTYKNSLKTGK